MISRRSTDFPVPAETSKKDVIASLNEPKDVLLFIREANSGTREAIVHAAGLWGMGINSSVNGSTSGTSSGVSGAVQGVGWAEMFDCGVNCSEIT